MWNETEARRPEIRRRAEAAHTKKLLDLLLAMDSGTVDTAATWCSVAIETYSRSALSETDDLRAETKMSAWVAGFSDSTATPRQVTLAGQRFAVSVFAIHEGTVKKGAVIWTTIRKGKLLSFAFVANSPERLKELTETMKTVHFY